MRGAAAAADCTGDGALTVADFGCFQTKFVGGSPYADRKADGVRRVADFGSFQAKLVAGCRKARGSRSARHAASKRAFRLGHCGEAGML